MSVVSTITVTILGGYTMPPEVAVGLGYAALKVSSPAADNVDGLTEVGC